MIFCRQTRRIELDFKLVFGYPMCHTVQISKIIGIFLYRR